MKTYDLLLSFGCSFTEGGGLNDPRYHKFLKTNIESNKEMHDYMTAHSFPKYLADRLRCEFINFGQGAAGNELIFQKVYDECKPYINSNKKILVTVQTSVLSRVLLNSANNDQVKYVVNTPTNQPAHIAKFYNLYIEHFYNQKAEFNKLLRFVDLLQTWLTANNFDFVFIAWESVDDLIPNTFFKFPVSSGSLGDFSFRERLLIKDIPHIPYIDHHLTEQGNAIVANLIFNYLKDKYD